MKAEDIRRRASSERLRELGFELGGRVRHVDYGLAPVIIGRSAEGKDRADTIKVRDDDGDVHHYRPDRLEPVDDDGRGLKSTADQ